MIDMLIELFKDGGIITGFIFLVSMIAWCIGLRKWLFFRDVESVLHSFANRLKISDRPQLPMDTKPDRGMADSRLSEIINLVTRSSSQAQIHYQEYQSQTIITIEQGFSTMAVCISSAPLLGLLGTIMGMNHLFSVITEFGIGSPSLMAEGIALALKATLTGLAAAVAAMFLLNYLAGRKDLLIDMLRKNGEALSLASAAK